MNIPALEDLPYYRMVPKEPLANLLFRQKVIALARSSQKSADTIWAMCAADPLFYINTFSWTYDPRKQPSAVPFITYEFQDEAIVELLQCAGEEDVFIEKSRDMGASWICVSVMEWIWHFKPRSSCLMGSRKEEYVDKKGDPKCLFWKILFVIENLPAFLRPVYEKTALHLLNLDNDSTLDGESTNSDFARGDRRLLVFLDEFSAVENGYEVLSATGDVTRCRIYNGTPKGTGNAFYDISQDGRTRKLRFHWSAHPEKGKGLYRWEEGKEFEALDPSHDYPVDYPYIRDGKLRSPWYDGECRRRLHPMEVAQELDIDYLGAASQFFDGGKLEERRKEHVMPALHAGEFEFDRVACSGGYFAPTKGGHLKLWMDVNSYGMPVLADKFIVGCDIATGTGSSNSTISIGARGLRKKVAGFAHSRIAPHDLAKLAVALCRWLGNAFLIWEANGPGQIFGNEVVASGYRNFHYRKTVGKVYNQQTESIGFHSNRDTKRELIGTLKRAIEEDSYLIHDLESYKEMAEYVYTPDGAVAHARSATNIDPSGAKANHGDRVIADALVIYAMGLDSKGLDVIEETEVLPGSLAWRRLQRRRSEVESRKEHYVYG